MFQFVTCKSCGGHNPGVEIRARYWQGDCACCHGRRSSDTTFHFCNVACMTTWLADREVAGRGLPCPCCVDARSGLSTGFFAGFEANGPCPICGGSGRFREAKQERTGCAAGRANPQPEPEERP
jgi:hypothetical protein